MKRETFSDMVTRSEKEAQDKSRLPFVRNILSDIINQTKSKEDSKK